MSANVRQRVFDAMAQRRGEYAPPETWASRCAGVGVESTRAVLKWLCQTGHATKRRTGRSFVYALGEAATRPVDGRTREGRSSDVATAV